MGVSRGARRGLAVRALVDVGREHAVAAEAAPARGRGDRSGVAGTHQHGTAPLVRVTRAQGFTATAWATVPHSPSSREDSVAIDATASRMLAMAIVRSPKERIPMRHDGIPKQNDRLTHGRAVESAVHQLHLHVALVPHVLEAHNDALSVHPVGEVLYRL